ncbi:uncharacterized protein K02A2.6-like [Sabethes cyaneus]|uniref:uncharacterized protein K02A2.6-like n=1 Tax=Sabethes cyaneus TaxID=53552 RepID=UPI00237D94EC|nr:uncharacterized protein K02A2.6-like [Sabethes cyaneus]
MAQAPSSSVAVQCSTRNELVLDSLASNITEFVYDLEQGCSFDTWFSRYADLFEKYAAKLDDSAKVRLLLRKLNPAAHDRYTSFILPKLSKDFDFAETIKKLKTIFGTPVSTFNRRYQCLQTTKDDHEDFISYSCKVNRSCVDFKLQELKEDQFKCLIFVCGLKSVKDADIRMRLLAKINETQDITLEKVVEECKNLINLKQDTVLIGNKSSSISPSTNAVRIDPKQKFKGRFTERQDNTPKTPCWSCGGMHFSKECQFKEHKCRDCGKMGHREGHCACFTAKNRQKPAKFSNKMQQRSSKSVFVGSVKQGRRYTKVNINGIPINFQLDSGSDITIISRENWEKVGCPPTDPSDCIARTASGGKLHISDMFEAAVSIGGVLKTCKTYMCGSNLNLNVLGSHAMDRFGLWDVPLSSICNLVHSSDGDTDIAELKSQFPDVFSSAMGLRKKTQVHLTLKPNAQPVFKPKRPVAYSVRSLVEDELGRLESLGIITPVTYADWATPIVVVRRPNRSVRICADFSTGLNNALMPNSHPLPLPEDIFARMANCTIFGYIDLSDAYLQVEVDDESRKLLVINTHKGLFRFNRLSPGIRTAPGEFQQIMDAMLSGIEYVCPYLDDILVGGQTRDELKHNLKQILARLQEYGFTVRIEKCSFFMNQVKYLGQLIDREGIRPDPEKIAAIISMPAPHDVPTLRSYLGAVNYYGKYIREMKNLRQPLDELLKKGSTFKWSSECQRSFDRFKEVLQSPLLLTHYNPRLDIVVSADASNVGIGARIAHCFPDGSEKAIYHASRSLTPATDHFGHADILSRLINSHIKPDEDYVIASLELESIICGIVSESVGFLPVTYKMIAEETARDDILQKVKEYIQNGWPQCKQRIADSPEIQQFFARREALSVAQQCLMYAERIVVPKKLQKRILQQLHKGHPGIDRTRSLARNFVYWPNIDDHISDMVRACKECAMVAKSDTKTSLQSWPIPEKPWQRVHIDYAGPVNDMYFLVLVDALSKWSEVCHLLLNTWGINPQKVPNELRLEDVPMNDVQRELLQEVFVQGAEPGQSGNKETSELRRSSRNRKQPVRYEPYRIP